VDLSDWSRRFGAGTASGVDAAVSDPDRFRIDRRGPRAVARPANREELCDVLRAATSAGQRIVPWGAGTSLPRERAPEGYDLALDLTRLDRIIEYEPEDLTLTAECGVTIDRLRALVAEPGQELPLEAPFADRTTLGGALASNAAGPRRFRFGAPRDRILGARVALAGGELIRSGGKVVKNVAGYGTHRLLCGSGGGLAIIVEASLKLMPAPLARAALVYELQPEQVADRSLWNAFRLLEPAVLSIVGSTHRAELGSRLNLASHALPTGAHALRDDGIPSMLAIGFEEDPPLVEERIATTIARLGAPVVLPRDREATELWQALTDLEERDGARLTFATADSTPAALASWSNDPSCASAVFHAPAGRLHVFPATEAVHDLVRQLKAAGFTLIGARGLTDSVIRPAPANAALRERVRAALDPGHRFALGQRWVDGFL
jgi:FAD/FMN-containing dehydrogenase